MAVKWSWKAKLGEVDIVNTALGSEEKPYVSHCTIYAGSNCLAVILYEYVDKETNKEMYQFVAFFDDMKHVKNCLKDPQCFTHHHWKIKFNLYDIKSKENKENVACMKQMNRDMLKMSELFALAGHEVQLSKQEEVEL